MNNQVGKFIGRYRGVVVSNTDPDNIGRLLVRVEDVMGSEPCLWASPASVVAGTQMGIYAIPPVNAGVWVEFEDGDPNDPVWTGSLPGSSAEVPSAVMTAPPASPPIVLQSLTQNRIIISSVVGEGITLETVGGVLNAKVVISPMGIKLSIGKSSIELDGMQVKINGTALVIK